MTTVVRLAIALFMTLVAGPARPSYINPLPYNNKFDLGGNIDGTAYPFIGIWGDDTGTGGTFNGRCSATVVATTTRPAKTFVLTAAHCASGLAEDHSWQFQFGEDKPTITVDEVHNQPNYNAATKRNDVAVGVSSSTPEGLKAVGLPGKNVQLPRTFFAAGFGTTGFDGTTNVGFGKRRRVFAEISAVNDAADEFTMPRGGTGANTPDGIDPLRHLCSGDSGGPSFTLDGTLIGVHSRTSGGNTYMDGDKRVGRCDGSQLRAVDASMLRPENRLFVASYVLATVLFDQLQLNLQQGLAFADGFEPDPANSGGYAYGNAGVAPGWHPLPAGQWIAHPAVPRPIGSNPAGWEYFNAIGTTADRAVGTGRGFDDPDADPGPGRPDLFTDGSSSQGAILMLGGPSVIYRDFVVSGGSRLHVGVKVRKNSVGLSSDVGVQLPDGDILWGGLSTATLGDVDRWQTLSLDVGLTRFSGAQTVRVLLMTAGNITQTCDVDGNGVIDRNDINALMSARNTPASPEDPRDVDHDGAITVNDARSCTLRCTNARCTP